jgi:hypothetical protein
MELIVLFIVLATTVWVGVDASGRDWSGDRFANSTTKWVIGMLLPLDRCLSGLRGPTRTCAAQGVVMTQNVTNERNP